MTRRRRSLGLLLLVVCALVLCVGADTAPVPIGTISVPEGTPVSLAWWSLVVLVGGWILKGLEVAGRVSLQILAWSVKALWAFAISVQHAAIAIGKGLATFGKAAWRFLRTTYREVLRPAWDKFWKVVDRIRGTLERVFRPVLEFLETIRRHLLGFYEKWIRPILDTIGVARRVAQVLASLGLEWARALDRELARIEEAIDRPFRLVLAKINEAINVVNRIVDANGLFQRLTLIRSLERDMGLVYNAWQHARSKPLTDADRRALAESNIAPTPEEIFDELDTYLETRDGPLWDRAERDAFEADALPALRR